MSIALSLGLPTAVTSVAAMRSTAATVARACGLERRDVEDVRLAVSEAATRLVLGGSEGDMRLEATATDDGELTVVVGGAAPDPRRRTERCDLPAARLGLPVIVALAQRVELSRSATRAQVRMTFARPAPRAAARRAARAQNR